MCVYLLHLLSSPDPKLDFIDHVVGNQGAGEISDLAINYEKTLQFHRFWSIDDDMVKIKIVVTVI